MALPIPVPARLVGSLGPVKRDLHPPPNYFLYLGAQEVNLCFDLIIRLINEVNGLGLAGATGSLQGAYNNSPNPGPVIIQLDSGRQNVMVSDTAGGLGIPLLGVKTFNGAISYGLAATGYYLADLPTAIQSDANVSVQMYSRQASPAPAYVLSGSSPYTALSEVFLLMKEGNTNTYARFTGDRSILFNNHGASTILWGLSPEAGAIRLVSDAPAGKNFLPAADGQGALGGPSDHWDGVFSSFYAGSKQTATFGATVTIDCSQGNIVEIPVTGELDKFVFTNPQDGVLMTLVFLQNATGDGFFKGPLDTGYRTLDGKYLAITPSGNAVDVSVWQYVNSATLKWVEVARSSQNPSYRRTALTSISGGSVTLIPSISPQTQVFEGTLGAAEVIDLGIHSWVRQGDQFEIIFSDDVGVTTTTSHTLSITTDNGVTTLKLFNLNATVHGRVHCYYTGSAWKISVGNSVLYV